MCAHATKTAALRARERRESLDYDAFISYTHEDRAVAAGMQEGLQGGDQVCRPARDVRCCWVPIQSAGHDTDAACR